MTARFTLDPPVAGADTWAGRSRHAIAPRMSYDRLAAHAAPLHQGQAIGLRQLAIDDQLCGSAGATDREAQIEAIFRANMARRDAAAKEYGEPETPHELYGGRPGSQAETIVCNCLRALQAIPEIDRLGADVLMDVIARDYLTTALDAKTSMRRTMALLRIAGEKT